MGYRIIYAEERKKPENRNNQFRLRTLVALCLLVFSLTVKIFWPEGTQKLREVIIPAGMTQTQEDFQTMLHAIMTGEPVMDAVTAFCAGVVDHGTDR